MKQDNGNHPHTPGPWAIRSEAPTIVEIPSQDEGVFFAAYGGTEANARLIAAAPELLEALDGIIDLVPTDCQAQARAVIAKAKGD